MREEFIISLFVVIYFFGRYLRNLVIHQQLSLQERTSVLKLVAEYEQNQEEYKKYLAEYKEQCEEIKIDLQKKLSDLQDEVLSLRIELALYKKGNNNEL